MAAAPWGVTLGGRATSLAPHAVLRPAVAARLPCARACEARRRGRTRPRWCAQRRRARSSRGRPSPAQGAGSSASGLLGVHRHRVSLLPARAGPVAPTGGQCGVRRARCSPCPTEAWGESTRGWAWAHGLPGPGSWRGPDGHRLAWARLWLQAGASLWARRRGPHPAPGGRRDGPGESGRPQRGARGARALPRRFRGPRDHATGGHASVPAGHALDGLACRAPPQAQARASLGPCAAGHAWGRRAAWLVGGRRVPWRGAAPPSRGAVSARFVPIAGRGDGLVGGWRGASSAARVRRRGLRRRSRAGVARMAAGDPDAWGSRSPRSPPAMVRAAIFACVAWPPWSAGRERACPRTNGMPARAQRAARPDQGTSQATHTTRAVREGATAVRNGSGPAGRSRWPRIAPSCCRPQRSRVRACTSMPQENCGCLVSKRMRSPPLCRSCSLLPADHGGMRRRGPQ